MQRIPRLLAAAIGLAAVSLAQSPTPPTAPQPAASQTAPVDAITLVDIVVQDKTGRPVRGLKANNFRLTENATPQAIIHFEEHSSTAAQLTPAIAPMPPGMFTDYTPVPPSPTLNILIVDSLNTPLNLQRFMYGQLQEFVNHADPKAHIAIFGLANHLVLLQGFDSDPAALKTVIGHQLIPRSAALANHANAGTAQKQPATDGSVGNAPATDQIAANVEQFQDQIPSIETQLRPQLTLDAFNTLGHYLSSLPGRKNIIWLSGSFPLNLSSTPAPKESSNLATVDQDELHETTLLLANAQASLYPIDARVLLTHPLHSPAPRPLKANAPESRFTTTVASEHASMTSLAAATGGKAFFDVNNVSDAVRQSIDLGSSYYTLGFNPTNQQIDGKYRDIAVEITGDPQASALQLSYNHGYYAPFAQPAPVTPPSQATANSPDTQSPLATAYSRAAMSRGAPAPESVLFKVRVLPAAAVTETKIAPGNTLDPSVSPTGPFRNFNVDYISLLNQLTLHMQPGGTRTGAVEFVVYVFDVDGRLLNAVGKVVTLSLPTATYQRVAHSAMEFHLEISAPTSQETFLRIGMRDVPANRFGVVELPTATVSHLNPLELKAPPLSKSAPLPSTAPPPGSSTPAPPATVPSTPPPPATTPNPVPPS